MTSATTLIAWAEAATKRGRYPFLLIDTAFAENAHAQLIRWKVPFWSLFAGTTEEPMLEIAPLLVPLRGVDPVMLGRVCEWSMAMALKCPMLSWLESSQEGNKLSAHLINFHKVGVPDGQTMLMRWYDTRILPVWMGCLRIEQQRQFTAALFSLHYINRFGDIVELFCSETAGQICEAPQFGAPLVALDLTQYGILVDAGDLDTMISHLRRVIKDEMARLPPRLAYEFISLYLQRAVDAGVTDLDRQTQYVLLALYTSGRATDEAACVELMNNPPQSLQEFCKAMEALPQMVWAAGKPLWEATESKSN
jgi:hypothetical protein